MKKSKILKIIILIVISLGLFYYGLKTTPIKLSNYFKVSSITNSITNPLSKLFTGTKTVTNETRVLESEESTTIRVVKQSLPSVVTVGIDKTIDTGGYLKYDPFNFFQPFQQVPGTKQKIDQNIGSGFIVSSDGVIVTNKHVVSDTKAGYKVITNDDKKYTVTQIYRDPLNDLALLKIDAAGLMPLSLGDSSNLQLGQFVIAVGTPLGEFRNTVTSGIISGLGRGITAGSVFEGAVEKLDNVIQTDAAISPGNSGGPLLNSSGQVIGINTAIAEGGQNIGFAIPVNAINTLLKNFQQRGSSFDQAFLGVRYKLIDKNQSVISEIPQGAYVMEVIADSPADKAKIQQGDVITQADGQKLTTDGKDLASIVSSKKPGDKLTLQVWRNNEFLTLTPTLEKSIAN